MKYFCCDHERNGTCYHEFQRGEWDGKTFWRKDSICIHDDEMIRIGLDELLKQCIQGYDPLDVTAVSLEQWDMVCKMAKQSGGSVAEAVEEANEWVRAGRLQAFSILGI